MGFVRNTFTSKQFDLLKMNLGITLPSSCTINTPWVGKFFFVRSECAFVSKMEWQEVKRKYVLLQFWSAQWYLIFKVKKQTSTPFYNQKIWYNLVFTRWCCKVWSPKDSSSRILKSKLMNFFLFVMAFLLKSSASQILSCTCSNCPHLLQMLHAMIMNSSLISAKVWLVLKYDFKLILLSIMSLCYTHNLL